MTTNDDLIKILIARLTRTEGRKRKMYVDTVGKVSIGVGHNLTDKGLPDEVVDLLLRLDIAEAIRDAESLAVYSKLSPERQSVIVDMVFNMGLPVIRTFINTLHLLDVGDFKGAAAQMLKSKWAEQVGNRAIELARIIETGEIANSSKMVA